jgi:hypothetical protein
MTIPVINNDKGNLKPEEPPIDFSELSDDECHQRLQSCLSVARHEVALLGTHSGAYYFLCDLIEHGTLPAGMSPQAEAFIRSLALRSETSFESMLGHEAMALFEGWPRLKKICEEAIELCNQLAIRTSGALVKQMADEEAGSVKEELKQS